MQMKEKLNRIAAFILSVCMALACTPMTALAAGWIERFRGALRQSYFKALIPRLIVSR